MRAAGKAHAAQRLFWRWKLRRPHLTQRVWVLFLLLPKLPVPFPCTYAKSKHHQKQIRIRSTQNKEKKTIPLIVAAEQKPNCCERRGREFTYVPAQSLRLFLCLGRLCSPIIKRCKKT